ncbi:VCBS domain-containing protein, partial [Zwartia sp.]|uniref:VCBS domain-containing protein n=1 Tax=Zwartia sp. TaxID=2978004 RepID=UPI002727ACD6
LAAGEALEITVNYTVTDDESATDNGSFTITVTGTNDAPVATADVGAVDEDATLTVDVGSGVLKNDRDVDAGTTLVVSGILSGATGTATAVTREGAGVVTNDYGTLTINADGSYSFVANGSASQALTASETADVVFTYTATDGTSPQTKTLTITVTGTNDPIAVSNPIINEASPYAFFILTGYPNQPLTLELVSGTATTADYGTVIQYSIDSGLTWLTYTGGSISLSSTNGTMLVRTPINQDATNEPDETFALRVTNTSGFLYEGTATIQDDGNGIVYNDNGTENTKAIRDDDRTSSLPTITVSSLTVSEASLYANFTVTLSSATASDINFNPVLTSGTAIAGTDTGAVLQYFNGSNWIDVDAGGVTIQAGQRSVNMRFALVQDSDFNEGTENVFVSTGTVVGVQNAIGAIGIINISDVESLRDPVITDVLETPTDPTPFDLLTAKGDDQSVTVVGENASLVTLFNVFNGVYTQVTGVTYVTTEISPGLYVLNFSGSLIEAGEYVVKLSKQNYESNYSNSFTVDSTPGLYDIAGLRKNVLLSIPESGLTDQLTEGGVGGMDQNRFPSFWNGTNWLDSDGQVIRFNLDSLLLFDAGKLPDAVSVTKTLGSGSTLALNTRTGLYVYNPSDTATIDIFTLTASDGNKGASLTLTFDAKDTLDRDGITGAVESRLSDLVGGGVTGDLNNDGIRDEIQNAVTTLAWMTFDDFNAGIKGSLNETKPIISLIVVDSMRGNNVDATSQLANVSVLSQFDDAVGGSKPINADWDPIQFSIEPLQSMGILDADPNRQGVQLRIVIDIARSGIAEGGFNAYMKYVPQTTIDSYAAIGVTLTDLDGTAVTKAGWYDFTQRTPGGDGARFVVERGQIIAIEIVFTDNKFGDNDTLVNRIKDPGVPVSAPPVVTPIVVPSPEPIPTAEPVILPVAEPVLVAAGEQIASRQAFGLIAYPPRLINSALDIDEVRWNEVLYSKAERELMGGNFATRAQFLDPSLNNTSLKTEAPLETASPQSFALDSLPLRTVVMPPDVSARAGQSTVYELPVGVFSGGTGAIQLVAMLQDGSPLPTWIKFDPIKGNFTVNPPRDFTGPIEIKIEATDSKGEKAQAVLKIQIRGQVIGLVGKPSITMQFDEVLRRSA